ncbi:MAG: hypothetical protein K8W52_08745 [Deltaproteobacteria bacterium]|nr:hypothetical protein [Deltaproteobacteria bacterium]
MIDSTTAAAPLYATQAPSTGKAGAMTGTRDEFLKLFVAQLEHQNPLDPQSGADMVAQLAQFSSVEQATKANQTLAEISANQASSSNESLAALVGKGAITQASSLTLDGPPPPIRITTDKSITSGSVVIKNAAGTEIRRLPLPPGRGPFDVTWDGKDAEGVDIPTGAYSISVEAKAAGGGDAFGTPTLRGVIDAVDLGPDGPRLRIGHALLTPADVQTIGLPGVTSWES